MRASSLGVGGCLMMVVIFGIAMVVGGYLLKYDVQTIAGFFGKAVVIPMPNVITMICGAILSEMVLPVAAVVWLLHFVL